MDDPVEQVGLRILPSAAEKIRQSIMYGSVFLALETGFINHPAVLEWLATAEVNEQTQIAYKAVCMKIAPGEQYLPDGDHFLVKRPEYALMAVGCGLFPEIPARKTDLEDEALIVYIVEHLSETLNRQLVRNKINLILSGQGPANYVQINLVPCYQARNFPHLRDADPHTINIGLVLADWTAKFRYTDKLAKLILHRVANLQRDAPIYFAGVGYKAYHQVIMKLNQEKLFNQLTRDELITLDTFFPGIIDRKILNYNDLAYKLALLGNDIAGYILGFPIQNVIPNDEQIHEALAMLTTMGCSGYTDQIKNYVSTTYTPMMPIVSRSSVYSNQEDVLMEEIDDYVPFDIVAYQDGGYIYRFTRPEFDKIIESKKNAWTNNWLPPSVLSTIKARHEAATELKLPPSRIMREMLTRIEDGTLFNPDEIPVVPPVEETPTNPLEVTEVGGWIPGFAEGNSEQLLQILTELEPDAEEEESVDEPGDY